MHMAIGILLFIGVAIQWFTEMVWLRIVGPVGVEIHRDEWPAFYWMFMLLEVGGGCLMIYWSLTSKS